MARNQRGGIDQAGDTGEREKNKKSKLGLGFHVLTRFGTQNPRRILLPQLPLTTRP